MPIWLAIIGVSEYDSGIMLNDDENEAVMGETGQRSKVGGVFLRKLGGVGFSAQHRLACQFMMMEKETVQYVQRPATNKADDGSLCALWLISSNFLS